MKKNRHTDEQIVKILREADQSTVTETARKQHWFRSIEEAREEINDWRHHYNHERPHSALNYRSPVEFAARAA